MPTRVPLAQHVQEAIAAMRRIARVSPGNITAMHPDVQFLALNSDFWDMALGHSLNLRYSEFAALFPRTVRTVIIFGSVAVVLYNVVGAVFFAALVRSIGAKVQWSLSTLLLLPRRSARRLAGQARVQLNRLASEM